MCCCKGKIGRTNLPWGLAALGFSTPSTGKAAGASPLRDSRAIIGVQHPLHRQSRRSLPAQRLASLAQERVLLRCLRAPSSGLS
jgi:hypothetical protein